MAGPWEKYGGAPAPQQVEAPGVIMGRPRAPDPYRVQQDQISNANEAERLRLAQEGANISRQKDELDIAKKQREAAAGDMGDAIEAERKAAAFLLRALGSNRDYEAQDIGPRSWVGQKMADNAPDILNELPSAIGNSPERQISDSAQDAFIAASLRQDSGAAIPPEELERQRRIYFPMPGDGPEVIAAKRVRRQEALAGLKMASGRLVDETLSTFESEFGGEKREIGATASLLNPAGGRPATPGDDAALGPGEKFVFDETGNPIGIQAADGSISGYSSIVDEQSARDAEQALRDQGGMGYAEGGEAGLYRGVSLGLSDEIAGLGGGIHSLLSGESFSEGYRQERDIERAAQKISREQSGFLPELVGGVLAPAGVLGRASNVGQFARQGAVVGGVAGAGEGEGLQGTATNALLGAGVGAAAGAATGKVSNALSSGNAARSAAQADRNALLQDFQQEGVRTLPANVGGTVTNRMTAGMAQSPVGSGPIRAAAKQQGEDFGQAVGNTASRSGRVMPADEAGESFRQSARAGIDRDGQRIGRIYDAAKKEAAGVKIKPNQGIRQIDDEIAALSETREINQPLITELEKLKSSLRQNAAMSIDGLKNARSFAGKAASNQELRATPAKATMARVFDALARDFEGGLQAAGKGKAATLFKRADGLWKARIDDIDGAWEPIIGSGKSGEDIVKSIETMAAGGKGGFARLKTVLSGASPAERGDMIATLIDRMGHARKGAQNAEGDVFSPNVFLTNWNGMGKKAKALMFGNSELRQSLDRLSRISESVKDSAGFANTSNTGGAIAAQGLIGAGGYGVGNLPGLALTTGATYLTGKLLASPRFAAWLARAPRSASPAANRAYVDKLRTVAAAEPAISGEVNRFAQFLNAANDASPARAAAQGQQEDN